VTSAASIIQRKNRSTTKWGAGIDRRRFSSYRLSSTWIIQGIENLFSGFNSKGPGND